MITLNPLLRLNRLIHGDNATIGKIVNPERDNEYVCWTVERSAYGVPCRIPKGLYRVKMRVSPRLEGLLIKKGLTAVDARLKARVWELQNVAGRTAIQIHVANRYSELQGCIAPGLSNGKDNESVESSTLALNKLTSYLGGWDAIWELEVCDG
jgi:hypothetical protein